MAGVNRSDKLVFADVWGNFFVLIGDFFYYSKIYTIKDKVVNVRKKRSVGISPKIQSRIILVRK